MLSSLNHGIGVRGAVTVAVYPFAVCTLRVWVRVWVQVQVQVWVRGSRSETPDIGKLLLLMKIIILLLFHCSLSFCSYFPPPPPSSLPLDPTSLQTKYELLSSGLRFQKLNLPSSSSRISKYEVSSCLTPSPDITAWLGTRPPAC